MEYMGNKDFWEAKFACKGDKPLEPEKTLIDNIEYFKKGTVLDIACGDGRNTLFLLEKGFAVTGVDFSQTALDRLKHFAAQRNQSAATRLVDLSKSDALSDIGVFDNIVVNHYRLNINQLKNLGGHISKGGILFICGFGDKHIPDSRIRKEDLLQPKDFEVLAEDFQLLKFTETKDETGYFVTYVLRRK